MFYNLKTIIEVLIIILDNRNIIYGILLLDQGNNHKIIFEYPKITLDNIKRTFDNSKIDSSC